MMRAMPTIVSIALLSLAVLYLAWFRDDPQRLASWLVFALPPLLLGSIAWRSPLARFWAAVFALGWFSHGVMSAWTQPAHRGFAAGEIGLALLVIGAASWNGLRARFAGTSQPRK